MKNRKIYLGLFVFAVLMTAVLFGERYFTEEITVGYSIQAQERPAEWNQMISTSVNDNGLYLIVDGMKIEFNEVKMYMDEEMHLMLPAYIFTDAFSCSISCVKQTRVMIQKGTTAVTIEVGSDYITVNQDVMQVPHAASVRNGNVYIQAEVLEKAFAYRYKWTIDDNTLMLSDTRKSDKLLPSKFSYADIAKLPEVKNQGNLSTCWAFAAISALESRIRPEDTSSFSVDNMSRNNGFTGTQEDGGECMRAIAYLTAWKGPVLDADDPYGDGICNTEAEAVKHVQQVQIIDSKNFESIKKAVFMYGGVQSSLYTNMVNAKGSSRYYNKENAAYCYIGTQKPNHDVVIVGWDDNYSKSNFSQQLEGDGAFICMNSWGADFGNNGLFYVSYYDSNIGMHNVVYTGVEGIDNYDHIYQSDLCGWVGQMGYTSDTAYFSNVYDVAGDETLEAVGFYATGKATEYEIYVVPNYEDTSSFDDAMFVQKGSFANAGFYTVNLEKTFPLTAGSQCAVMVKITTPDSIHPIAVEYRANAYTAEVDLSDGDGYISLNGQAWENVEESKKCNICLKMYTSDTTAASMSKTTVK